MVKTTLNLKEDNGVTQVDITATLNEAYGISNDLLQKLAKIRINVDKNKSPELITAIQNIFGETYISRTGNSVITYEMYCSVINLIRQLGTSKAEELL